MANPQAVIAWEGDADRTHAIRHAIGTLAGLDGASLPQDIAAYLGEDPRSRPMISGLLLESIAQAQVNLALIASSIKAHKRRPFRVVDKGDQSA